jgi:flagellar motor protein MotB
MNLDRFDGQHETRKLAASELPKYVLTDPQGVASNYDNQTLSHNRAMQTRAYLKSLLGAHKVSITLDALAYAKPVAPNVTSTGQAANRRVEIDVH